MYISRNPRNATFSQGYSIHTPHRSQTHRPMFTDPKACALELSWHAGTVAVDNIKIIHYENDAGRKMSRIDEWQDCVDVEVTTKEFVLYHMKRNNLDTGNWLTTFRNAADKAYQDSKHLRCISPAVSAFIALGRSDVLDKIEGIDERASKEKSYKVSDRGSARHTSAYIIAQARAMVYAH